MSRQWEKSKILNSELESLKVVGFGENGTGENIEDLYEIWILNNFFGFRLKSITEPCLCYYNTTTRYKFEINKLFTSIYLTNKKFY